MPTTQTDPAVIKLDNVRLSYPQLWTPKAIEEGKKPKYSATFLLDIAQHKDLIKVIEAKTERAALDYFKKKVTLKFTPLRDGNDKTETDGYGDGIMYVPTTCETRPPVVDRNLAPIAAEDGIIYAGCYVNATIRLFGWEHKTGGKGVSASLRAVQFLKKGKSFGADPVDAEDEFGPADSAMEEF